MFGCLLPRQPVRLIFISESAAVIHSAQRNTQICAKYVSLATLNWEKANAEVWKRLVFGSSYVHVRPCGGLANRGVAVSRPGLLGGPHASLHPCRMCRWWARLAQNRPREPQPREPGRPRLSRHRVGKMRRRWLKWLRTCRPSVPRYKCCCC